MSVVATPKRTGSQRRKVLEDHARDHVAKRLSQERARFLLHRMNGNVCDPPLPEDEVDGILDAAVERDALTDGEQEYLDDLQDLQHETPDPSSNGTGHGGEEELIPVRTYADVDDAPPAPLICDMLEPEGQTILYGAGGTGKGASVSCLTKRAQEAGLRVMLYDAEQRPREWARRFSSLGVDRAAVIRIEPKDLPAHLMGKPLYDVVPHLGRIARQRHVKVLFIDSILAAMGVGEEKLRSDAQAPYLVSRALDALEIASCCIGHTPRSTPDGDPYGSVAWINAFRLTWLATKAEGPGHRVRWKPRKRNERGHLPTSLWTFDWDLQGRLTGYTVADADAALRDWLRQALALGPRTVEDLADERLTDMDDVGPMAVDRVKATLRQALNRMRRDREAEKESGRGGAWRMRR